MKSKQSVLFLIAFTYCAIYLGSSIAGHCPWPAEFYLDCLEGKPSSLDDCPKPYRCFKCVGTMERQLDRWASDREARRFLEFREVWYHDWPISLAREYLDDPSASHEAKDAAAQALAFQGVRKINDHDVFEILARELKWSTNMHTWYTFAALADPRTVDLVRAEYRRLKEVATVRGVPPRPLLLEIIDCLYHIPVDEAVELVRELASVETDEQPRNRLQHVAWKRTMSK